MAVNYTDTVAAARLEAVRTALNANGGGALILMTAGSADLVSVDLDTVIGAPAARVLTVISAPSLGTAGAAGVATQARLVDGAGSTVASGLTVGTAASDVILNDTNIANGSLVTINSGTITTP
jgi:hypothetical protein